MYPQLLEFLGDAAHAETILCAHNAQFDMGFLSETLIRLGIIANFRYVDTLRLSRKYLKGMPNYKQTTLADCLGISVKDAHRAADDAQVCGEILQYVMGKIKDEIEEKKRQFEKACPQSVLFYCIFITGDRRRAKVNASPSLIRSGTTNGITHQARTIVRLTAPFAGA